MPAEPEPVYPQRRHLGTNARAVKILGDCSVTPAVSPLVLDPSKNPQVKEAK
jgi:hypothetical protein